VLIRSDSQLIEEGMMPDSLHVFPVVYDTVIDGVLELEDTSLGLGLITDISLLGVSSDHDTLLLGATNDGGETASGSIISGDTGLTLTRSVINNNCSLIVSRHLSNKILIKFICYFGYESNAFKSF
jgi:hypothetical protein